MSSPKSILPMDVRQRSTSTSVQSPAPSTDRPDVGNDVRRHTSLRELTDALQPVRRAWVRSAAPVLAGHGLSASLASVVLLASRFGPSVRQNALALELGIHPAALVRRIDEGEAAGLLVRSSVPGDRRAKVIELLPEGRRIAETMEHGLDRLRQRLLGEIPLADIETAVRVLRLLEDRCQERL